MAYEKFKPAIWSQYIQRELEKKCKLVEDCWKKFEGEVKHGKTVNIQGIGEVSIGNYTGAPIGAPQTVEDKQTQLIIDQAKFFNFMVDDVDRAQSNPGLMESIMQEATYRLALASDSHVASLAKDSVQHSESLDLKTTKKAKEAIDAGLLVLRNNDVAIEDEVVITLTPMVYQLLRDELVEYKTNNDELIKKGIVGMYDNCVVKMSTNMYNDGADDYCMIRTKKAIAFAQQIDEVEAYRPDQLFSDAVKGLSVFGAKIVRPKELYVLKVKNPKAEAAAAGDEGDDNGDAE